MEPLVRIDKVSKRFGKLQVLDRVELVCSQGASIALIGPNGCGKTTLIKCILNMVIPDSGTISFEERNIKGDVAYRQHIGYMPQIGRYPENMNVGQVLETIRYLRPGMATIDDDLFHAYKINDLLGKRMATLSGGTRQKVSAVIAFMFNPKVLILDEPTAGLDPVAAEILKEKIKLEMAKNKLFLITSHLLAELDEIISEVILMHDGVVRFHKETHLLKEETGKNTLAKAIAYMLREEQV